MDDLQATDPGVREGDILAGKYRVERVLGVGGMGVVVAAHHLQLDERVALKFLLPHALRNAEAVARFDQEARAAVKIKSEHVARVTDVGKLENGSPYMVMEYLHGHDLAEWLQKHGALPVEQAVDFVLQAGEAIAEAHSLGIVHRDLKPSNLFCIRRADGQQSIKVIDFGISKVSPGGAGAPMAMTRTTAMFGSPSYMSPEQMQSSKGVDSRTDLWSLGVILFELVTGYLPFDAGTVTELAIRIATEPAPLLSTRRSDLPNGFEQAVLKSLEKPRDRRYQDVADLALALAPFGSRHAQTSLERIVGTLRGANPAAERTAVAASSTLPVVQPAAPRASAAAVSTVAGTASATDPGPYGGSREKKPSYGIAAAIGIGVAALIVGALALSATRGSAPEATSATAASPPLPPAAMPDPPAPVVAPSPAAASPAAGSTASANPAAATAAAPDLPKSSARPAVVTRAPSRPQAPNKSQCDPPYYFDPQGNRVFKKACL